jgi:uncharacterized membrane protein YeaQ/YmgE (transglycosylase-associated protein family)
MEITIGNVIGWLVAGILAGSLAGMLVKRSREGFGRFGNLVIGLLGGLIGGSLFQIFNISLGLENISVSLQDLIAAFIGSLIFLTIVWAIKKHSQSER